MQNRMSITGVVEAVERAGVVADEASSWNLASLVLPSNANRPAACSCSILAAARRTLANSIRACASDWSDSARVALQALQICEVHREVPPPCDYPREPVNEVLPLSDYPREPVKKS